jgi:DNA-binding PadR family transcriptional regulator
VFKQSYRKLSAFEFYILNEIATAIKETPLSFPMSFIDGRKTKVFNASMFEVYKEQVRQKNEIFKRNRCDVFHRLIAYGLIERDNFTELDKYLFRDIKNQKDHSKYKYCLSVKCLKILEEFFISDYMNVMFVENSSVKVTNILCAIVSEDRQLTEPEITTILAENESTQLKEDKKPVPKSSYICIAKAIALGLVSKHLNDGDEIHTYSITNKGLKYLTLTLDLHELLAKEEECHERKTFNIQTQCKTTLMFPLWQ